MYKSKFDDNLARCMVKPAAPGGRSCKQKSVSQYCVFVPRNCTGCRTLTLAAPHCHCGLVKI